MFVRATAIVFFAFLAGILADYAVEKRHDDHGSSETMDYTTDNLPLDVVSTTAASVQAEAPSPLQTAHWCQLPNKTFIAKDQTFMFDTCTACRCLVNRRVFCSKLPCMQTFCVDNSVAAVPNGQCCGRCSYENGSSSCIYKNLVIPHGAVVKQTDDNVQCWCQLGSIECRRATNGGSGWFDDITTVYVVIIVICLVVLIGTLLCGGCSLLAYYYYRQNQTNAQAAVEQYWNNAGWQPVEDGVAPGEEKQVEAQQIVDVNQYPNGNAVEFIPPAYAMYNGAYASEEKQY